MVKENKDEFHDLIALRKLGYGKTSIVDYSFIIDKDYNARVRMKLEREDSSIEESTNKVSLGKDERDIVDKFISKYVSDKEKNIPLFDDEIDKYEKEELYYNNIIIEDSELNNSFHAIIDYIESEHEELSSGNLIKMYDDLNSNFKNKCGSK